MQGRRVRGKDAFEPRALKLEPLIPVLLVLTGKRRKPPAVGDLRHERGEDGPYGVAEAPVEEFGSQRVDGAAIGAAKAADPEGMDEAFEVSLNVAVPPHP